MPDREPLPQTLDELCDWIEKHAAAIYVREEFRGKWESCRLTELPPMRAIHHALRFIREGRVPVYVRSPQSSAPQRDGLDAAEGVRNARIYRGKA